MHGILQKKPGKTVFDLPSDVIRVSYCKDSGGLPDDACGFDPRGHRVATGWFVRGTEPTTYCDRHVLCTVDTVHGGVSHGFCPEEETAKRALIRVTRHFPMQIVVSDAQYVWRGEPSVIAPNPAESQAYFEASIPDFCGRSVTNTPFNRSCSAHTELQPPEEKYPQQGEALSTEPPGRSIPTPWDAERIPNKREEEIPPGNSPEEED